MNREILLGEDGHPKMQLKKQRHGPERGCVTRVTPTCNWKFWVKKRCIKAVKNGKVIPVEKLSDEKREEATRLKEEVMAKHQSRFARQEEVNREQQGEPISMCQEIEERSDDEYTDSPDVDDVFSCFNSSDVYHSGEGDVLLEGQSSDEKDFLHICYM